MPCGDGMSDEDELIEPEPKPVRRVKRRVEEVKFGGRVYPTDTLDRWLPAKFTGYVLAIWGSLFVGAWAGPIGVIMWCYITGLVLWFHGCTWENLKLCFIGSLGQITSKRIRLD